MNRDDLEKLLGGYATGTLTPEEREALFTAALEDQQLFDALAREEPLRELLQDPAAKSRLLAALEGRPALTRRQKAPWRFPRIWVPALVGAAAALIAVVAVERRSPPQPVMIAQAPRPVPPEPIASPLPQALEKRALPANRPVREVKLGGSDAASDRVFQAPAAPSPASVPTPNVPPPPAAVTPATATPLAAAEQVVVEPAPAQIPAVRSRSVVPRFEPVAGAPAIGGVLQLSDARALYYGARLPIQSSFLSPENAGRAPTRTVTAAVADAGGTQTAFLGVRYAVVQRQAGVVTEVDPTQALDAAGDIALRLEPNDAGYVYVFERPPGAAWSLLASDRLARAVPYTVPRAGALKFDDSGVKELFVLFSRQPQKPEDRVVTSPSDQKVSSSPAERFFYVVSTSVDAAGQKIGFPVTLRRK